MKKHYYIKYPVNRSETIKYLQDLNHRWLSASTIPQKRDRCKEILKITKEVQLILRLISEDQELQNSEEIKKLIQIWYKKKWRHAK